MRRRNFLQILGAASMAPRALMAAPRPPGATVLYNDRTTVLDHLQRAGVERRANLRKLSDSDIARAARQYESGDSLVTVRTSYNAGRIVRIAIGTIFLPRSKTCRKNLVLRRGSRDADQFVVVAHHHELLPIRLLAAIHSIHNISATVTDLATEFRSIRIQERPAG